MRGWPREEVLSVTCMSEHEAQIIGLLVALLDIRPA